MNRVKPIGMAYRWEIHSSYNYLYRALERLVGVRFLGPDHQGKPGYPPCAMLSEALPEKGLELSAFVFQEGAVWRGLSEVLCPSALVLHDQWPGDYGRIQLGMLADVVFTTNRDCVAELRESVSGVVEWLPFACDPETHTMTETQRRYDVGFVGHIHQPQQRFRREVLTELERKYRMNDFRKKVFLGEMARVYRQSKIVVNFPQDGGFNMRVFEAMASGAMLLTEDIDGGQDELLQEGRHLALYRNKRELFDKVAYYLEHEDERVAIAEQGRQEVLSKHTYTHRAKRMLEVLHAVVPASGRTTDPNQIAKAYAITYARWRRPDLVYLLLRGRGLSWRTRLEILLRVLKSIFDILRWRA